MLLFTSASLLLLALLLTVAAISKPSGGLSLSQQSLAGLGVPKPILLPISIALLMTELEAALLVIIPRTARWGAVAALGLLFNAAIVANLAVGKVEEDHEISH